MPGEGINCPFSNLENNTEEVELGSWCTNLKAMATQVTDMWKKASSATKKPTAPSVSSIVMFVH